MSRAKTIDRLEYTKSRTIVYPPAPIEIIESIEYDEEQGAMIMHTKPGVEICLECGTEIIHESGCVRCQACGWSRC